MKQRRIGNITPIYKRIPPLIPINSPSRTPTASSTAIHNNTSLPKNSATPTFRINQKHSKQIEMPFIDIYASSKEKVLENKIAVLRKEKNDLCTIVQRRELTFKKEMEKLKSNNESLKSIIKQIIPFINTAMNSKEKLEIQNILSKTKTAEEGIQCNILKGKHEERVMNKIDSKIHTTDSNKSTEEIKNYKNKSNENECIKNYAEFIMNREVQIDITKREEKLINVFPSFVKSLCISN